MASPVVYLPLVMVIRQKLELAQLTPLTGTEQPTISALADAHSGARVTSQGTCASVMASARATLHEQRNLKPLPVLVVDLLDAEEIAPGTVASAIVPQRLSRDPSFPVMMSRALRAQGHRYHPRMGGFKTSRLQGVFVRVFSGGCMCVRVRACAFVCKLTYIRTNTHTRTRTYTHTPQRSHTHARTHTHERQAHILTLTHTQAHTHARIHIHINTHNACERSCLRLYVCVCV